MQATTAASTSVNRGNVVRGKLVRPLLITALIALSAFALCATILATNWPFTRSKLTSLLAQRSAREVTIQTYRTTWFPPGCVAENISFLRHEHKDKQPIITLQRLVVRSSWPDLLTLQHKVPDVHVYGVHVTVPPRGPSADGKTHAVMPLNASSGEPLSIHTLFIHGAALDFVAAQPGKRPFHLQIRDLKLSMVRNNQPFLYEAVLDNPLPQGEIRSTGSFGPWSPDEPGATPVQGTFDYTHARLDTIPGIAGFLTSKGKFSGTLDKIETTGQVNVPDFRAAHSTHTENINADFHAAVDATNGDVFLNAIHASFGHTTIAADGSVTSEANHGGEVAFVRASVTKGRIEDLLAMFITAPTAPLAGNVALQTSIRLHSGPQHFLKRLEMNGDFETVGDVYQSPSTQGALDRLAESARGEKKSQENIDLRRVPSSLKGHVTVKNGIARASNLVLYAPQTKARMDGTYNLITTDVNLAGTLQTDGKISDTQQGLKSFALKVITPFLKHHKTTVVPFEIKGTYGHVSTSLDLDGKRKL